MKSEREPRVYCVQRLETTIAALTTQLVFVSSHVLWVFCDTCCMWFVSFCLGFVQLTIIRTMCRSIQEKFRLTWNLNAFFYTALSITQICIYMSFCFFYYILLSILQAGFHFNCICTFLYIYMSIYLRTFLFIYQHIAYLTLK